MEMSSKPYCLLHSGYNPPSRLPGQVLTFRSFHMTQHRLTPSCRLLATFLRRCRFLWANPNLPRRPPLGTTRRSPRKLSRRGCKEPRLRLRGGKDPPHAGPGSPRTRAPTRPRCSALLSCPRGAGGGGVHVPAPDNAPRRTRARADTHPSCASGCSAALPGPGTHTRREGAKGLLPRNRRARPGTRPRGSSRHSSSPAARLRPIRHLGGGAARARAVGVGPGPGRLGRGG